MLIHFFFFNTMHLRVYISRLKTRGGKGTENLYSSTSTVTLLKLYSITSKSTGVEKYLSKSTKYSSQKLLRVLITF